MHIWICSYVGVGDSDYGLRVTEGWGYGFVSTGNVYFGILTCGGGDLDF